MRADITFADGITTYAYEDDEIVANSVSVTMSTCSPNRYAFGTFNAATLKMGIIDDDGQTTQKDFSDAVVELYDDTTSPETALGVYYIDHKTVKRERNTINFSAYDGAIKFDIDIPDNVRATSYTAATAIQAACTACGITLSGSVPSGSPNTSITFKLENTSIQSWRDVVMWACQLVCANAVIDRSGQLTIRKAWYVYDAQPDFTCTASGRADIQFSDSRVYIKYLSSYSGNNVKTYTTSQTAPSQSVPGELTLSKNPLMDGKTETECDTVNTAYLAQPILSRQITAKLFDDNSISLGDLGVFSGGKIDVRRSIRGVVTGITWRYHGYTTITCTAPNMAEGSG